MEKREEVIKVKGKVLVILLVALLSLTIVMSTASASATKTSVIASQAGGVKPGTVPVTDTSKDGWITYTATTAGAVIVKNANGVTILTLNSTGEQTVVVNLKDNKGIVKFEPMRWVLLADKTNWNSEVGAFEGYVHGRVINYTLTPRFAWSGDVHVVFKGSGVFEGQMLVLEGARTQVGSTFNPLAWEGFLLTIP